MSRILPARRGQQSTAVGFGLAAVALLLAVPACSNGDQPSPFPTSTGHAGTAPPRTVTGGPAGSPSTGAGTPASWPELPAVARAHTPAGAEAFARYYFVAVNYAWTRPDPTIIAALASPACKSCANDESLAASLLAKGERYRDDPGETPSSQLVKNGLTNPQDVEVVWRSKGLDVVDGEGTVVRTESHASAIFRVSLSWTGDVWRVRKIYVDTVGK